MLMVAFTTSDGETVDQHFGAASHFDVWEVGPARAQRVGRVSALTGGDEEDRTSARAAAIAGCTLVYTMQIGGPAAAKLVARRIHPMKTQGEVAVAELVSRLQGVLCGNPPPWLRKAMGETVASATAGD